MPTMKLSPNAKIAALLALPLLIFVSIAAYAFYLSAEQTSAALSWPSTSGTIVSIGADEIKGRRGSVWCHNALYVYQADGKSYSNTRIQFGTRNCSDSKEQAISEGRSLFPNKNAPVHYNPANPSQSVLIQASPDADLAFFYGALALNAFIIAGTLLLLRRCR